MRIDRKEIRRMILKEMDILSRPPTPDEIAVIKDTLHTLHLVTSSLAVAITVLVGMIGVFPIDKIYEAIQDYRWGDKSLDIDPRDFKKLASIVHKEKDIEKASEFCRGTLLIDPPYRSSRYPQIDYDDLESSEEDSESEDYD